MGDRAGDRRKSGGGGKRRYPSEQARPAQVDSAEQKLTELIIKLGDNTTPTMLETHLIDLSATLVDPSLHKVILDAAFSSVLALPHKLSVYSVLLTLLCENQSEFASLVFSRFQSELIKAFTQCDYYSLKLLFRFGSELVNSNFISSAALFELFEIVLNNTTKSSLDHQDDRFVAQHIGDFYCSIIMSSLAINSSYSSFENTVEIIKEWVTGKRRQISFLSPFKASVKPSGELQVDNIHFTDDDYIGYQYQLFLTHIQPRSATPLRVILRPWEYPNIQTKLRGSNPDSPNLPVFSQKVSWFDPEVFSEQSIFELVTFRKFVNDSNSTRQLLGLPTLPFHQLCKPCHFTSPKPLFYIFPKSRTSGEGKLALSDMERWFAEDLILDILHFFRATHSEIPKQLNFCKHIESFEFDSLLCETIFKDFLRLPRPPYPVAHHAVILLDLCQQNPNFIPALAEATERLFGSISSMKAFSFKAFVDWFSHHLNNTDFKWSWKYWAQSCTSPEASQQLLFIQEVISKCIRLSYYDRIAPLITAAAPEVATLWLPPRPEPSTQTDSFYSLPLAVSIQNEITARTKPADSIFEPMRSAEPGVLSNEQIIRVVFRTLLLESTSSITQLDSNLSKYKSALNQLCEEFNGGDMLKSERILLQVAWEVHINSPQQFLIITNALLRHGLVSHVSILEFLLDPSQLSNNWPKLLFWEMIDNTLRDVSTRTKVLETEVQSMLRLKVRVSPDTPVAELAVAVSESSQAKEAISKISDLAKGGHTSISCFYNLMCSLIDTASKEDKTKSISLKEHLVELTLSHGALFVSALESIEPLFSEVEPQLKQIFEEIKYYCLQY